MSVESLRDFRSIYDSYSTYVRRTLYWLVPRDQLDDLTQEVFVRTWQRRHQFEGQSEIKTWIYKITLNIARDFHRRQNRQKRQQDHIPLPDAATMPEDPLRDIIEAAINQLPEKHKLVFILFYKQELTVEEIAKAAGIRTGTVKSRLFKARKDFTVQLEKEGIKV